MKKHITIFEHQSLKLHQEIDGVRFDEKILKAMQKFHGDKGIPYYSLIHNGIRFCQYVGVIQIGEFTIEILPKADKSNDKNHWRNTLIGMLKAVGNFKIQAPSSSALKIKTNSILELYFEIFIREVEYLLYRGLVKQYRKTESNTKTLKGRLNFSKNIQKNLIHKEQFFVNHTVYDTQHQLHVILYKTLKLIKQINNNPNILGKLSALLLNFPEMPDCKVSESLFDRIQLNRKTESYQYALDIARLLLLNYHPDLSKGNNNVLALLFDMNLLWEQFVYCSLRKHKQGNSRIKAQAKKSFWKADSGFSRTIQPDIFIQNADGYNIILDTKWKNINGANPSIDDLRQMYVYHNYFQAQKVALVYPGGVESTKQGSYFKTTSQTLDEKECSVITIPSNNSISNWQSTINNYIQKWIKQ